MQQFDYEGRKVSLFTHPLTDYIARQIHDTQAFYEIKVLEALRAKFTEVDVVIDGGANVGNHAVYFADYMNAKEVLAYEFVPENFKFLEMNAKDRAIKPILKCLGSPEQKGKLAATIVDGASWGNMGALEAMFDTDFGSIETVTLDDEVERLIGEGRKVSFIKLDCESSEENILKGAVQTLNKYRCPVLVEARFAKEYAALLAFFKELGYTQTDEFHGDTPLYLFEFVASETGTRPEYVIGFKEEDGKRAYISTGYGEPGELHLVEWENADAWDTFEDAKDVLDLMLEELKERYGDRKFAVYYTGAFGA